MDAERMGLVKHDGLRLRATEVATAGASVAPDGRPVAPAETAPVRTHITRHHGSACAYAQKRCGGSAVGVHVTPSRYAAQARRAVEWAANDFAVQEWQLPVCGRSAVLSEPAHPCRGGAMARDGRAEPAPTEGGHCPASKLHV
jgi:hypothetical protein